MQNVLKVVSSEKAAPEDHGELSLHSGLELAILTIISEMANVEASTGRDCQKGLKSAFFYQFDTDSY